MASRMGQAMRGERESKRRRGRKDGRGQRGQEQASQEPRECVAKMAAVIMGIRSWGKGREAQTLGWRGSE